MTGKDALWRQIVSSQLDHMLANMSGLTRNAEVLRALQSTEPVVLAESAQPLYNRLRASQVLTQLQITDLNGLVRFSMPQALTGTRQKGMVLEAVGQGKIQRGVERDEDGELLAVLAFPLYVHGKAAGAGVFAALCRRLSRTLHATTSLRRSSSIRLARQSTSLMASCRPS